MYATKAGLQFEVNAIGPPQLRIACVADLFRTFSTRAEIVLSERRAKLELASVVYTTVGVDSTSRKCRVAAASPRIAYPPIESSESSPVERFNLSRAMLS